MYEDFLKTKKFLSLLRNSKQNKIRELMVYIKPFEKPSCSGIWEGKGTQKIQPENRIILKNKDRTNKLYNISDVLKEIEPISNDLQTHVLFCFHDDYQDYFVQTPKGLNLEKCICFSNINAGTLNTFYPITEYGSIKNCQSNHEYLAGNSVLPHKENINIFTSKKYFKIDHLDKNYVHIFNKHEYSGGFLHYNNRYKMSHPFKKD